MNDNDVQNDSVLRRIEGFARSNHDAGYERGYVDAYHATRKSLARRSVLFLLAGLLVGGGSVTALTVSGVIGAPSRAPDPRELGIERGLRFTHAADFASQSTVGVVASSAMSNRNTGSGFILDDKGHVVTNQHVLNGASSFRIIWGSKEYAATLVGVDSATDIAVLRFSADGLIPASMTESADGWARAEEVLAIGSPFGLRNTVTSGIISHPGRRIRQPQEAGERGDDIPYIQTDCAINTGNSGGPLVNMQGRVIGMNQMVLSRSGELSGVGFAIPVTIVRDVALRIIGGSSAPGTPAAVTEGVELSEPFLGIELLPGPEGLLLTSVVTWSSAERAGLRVGDLLLSMDSQPVFSREDVMSIWRALSPGESVDVEVRRDGQSYQYRLEVGDRERTPGASHGG